MEQQNCQYNRIRLTDHSGKLEQLRKLAVKEIIRELSIQFPDSFQYNENSRIIVNQVLVNVYDKQEQLFLRYKKALEGLTPGGSEFVDDPERCAKFARERGEAPHRFLTKWKADQKVRNKVIQKSVEYIKSDLLKLNLNQENVLSVVNTRLDTILSLAKDE